MRCKPRSEWPDSSLSCSSRRATTLSRDVLDGKGSSEERAASAPVLETRARAERAAGDERLARWSETMTAVAAARSPSADDAEPTKDASPAGIRAPVLTHRVDARENDVDFLLDAMEAFRGRRYEPARKDGRPLAVDVVATMTRR